MRDKFLSKHTATLYYTIIPFLFVSFGTQKLICEVLLGSTQDSFFYGELPDKTIVHPSPIPKMLAFVVC